MCALTNPFISLEIRILLHSLVQILVMMLLASHFL